MRWSNSTDGMIVNYIKEHTPEKAIIFITGIGKCYPIIRSHTVLNNLHLVIDKVPVVLFYPGKYAINQEKQIAFTYYEYDSCKRKVLKNGGEVYVISPYHLVWNNDFYYVVGYSEKKDKVVTFRVDRIAAQPEILNQTALAVPNDFVLADFTKEVFSMYDGQEVEVELLCDNSLMKTMIDRFGEDVKTTSYNDTAFCLTTEVSASPTFFGWIFGFDGKVQILAPQEVKDQYKQMIIQASEKL